ncbi:MAG: hypothetical protein HY906_01605 [Deltaproteobacteria bacterium]|nr:hypothetical protein [Deltaproteobacteria bacterium]
MNGYSGGREILTVVAFGPLVFFVSYLVFHPPAGLSRFLTGHVALNVAATIASAAVVAYGCRRVVQALLRLCGFR